MKSVLKPPRLFQLLCFCILAISMRAQAFTILPTARERIEKTRPQAMNTLGEFDLMRAMLSDSGYARRYESRSMRATPTSGGYFGELTPLPGAGLGSSYPSNAFTPSLTSPNHFGGLTTLGPTPTSRGFAPAGLPAAPEFGAPGLRH